MMNTLLRIARLTTLVALLAFVACGTGDKDTAKQQADEIASTGGDGQASGPETDKPSDTPIAAEEPTETPAPKPKEPTPSRKKAVPPKPAPKPETVTIPEGTALTAVLNTHLRTDSNAVGDAFTASVTIPIEVDGKVVIPEGATLRGRLTEVEEPHRTSGNARMTLLFDELNTPDGKTYALTTTPIALEGESDKVSDEAKVGAGAVVGGIIGALTSKKKAKGAAVGAAAGAAAGGAVALATKGKQLDLPVGQVLSVQTTRPASVQIAP